MRLEQAFAVTLKRSVVDKQFAVEISNGRVRLASPWRDLVETQSGVPPQPESPRQAHVREREERPDAERRHDDASVFVGPCEHPHVAPGPEITVLHAREGKKSAVMQHGRCRTCGTRVARIRREGVWTTGSSPRPRNRPHGGEPAVIANPSVPRMPNRHSAGGCARSAHALAQQDGSRFR